MASSAPAPPAAATQYTQKPATNPASSSTTNKAKPSSTPGDSILAPLLRHFVGIDLLVETKQGRSYRGRLREADTYMNLVLTRYSRNAQQLESGEGQRESQQLIINNESVDPSPGNDGGESEVQFDLVHIRGPSIRYIVFGPDVDITGVIKAGRDRERAASDKYRRGIRKAR